MAGGAGGPGRRSTHRTGSEPEAQDPARCPGPDDPGDPGGYRARGGSVESDVEVSGGGVNPSVAPGRRSGAPAIDNTLSVLGACTTTRADSGGDHPELGQSAGTTGHHLSSCVSLQATAAACNLPLSGPTSKRLSTTSSPPGTHALLRQTAASLVSPAPYSTPQPP